MALRNKYLVWDVQLNGNKMSDQKNFIREIDEEVRQDNLKDAWKKYRKFIISFIFSIIFLVSVINFLDFLNEKKVKKQSELFFQAIEYVEQEDYENAQNLFKEIQDIGSKLDFSKGKKLLNTNLVNGFSEWDSFAKIIWPEKNVSLEIDSSKNLKHLVVFTPPKSNFFCIEPVSHSVDSFNLYHKGIKGTGTKILKPKKTFKVVTTFTVNFNQ